MKRNRQYTKSPPPVKRVVRDAGYKPALLASV